MIQWHLLTPSRLSTPSRPIQFLMGHESGSLASGDKLTYSLYIAYIPLFVDYESNLHGTLHQVIDCILWILKSLIQETRPG